MRKLLAACLLLAIPVAFFLLLFEFDWSVPAAVIAETNASSAEAVEPIEEWLKSDDSKVRGRAIFRAMDRASQTDASENAAAALRLVFEHIPTEPSEPLRYRFLTRLPREHLPVQPYLALCERLLGDDSLRVRLAAAREMVVYGKDVERAFRIASSALDRPDDEQRGLALMTLSEIARRDKQYDASSKRLIESHFTHPSFQVRAEALHARAQLDCEPETVRACLPFFGDSAPVVRSAAVRLLKGEAARNADVRRAIIQCLRDADRYVQADAIRAVARWQPCGDDLRAAYLDTLKTPYPFARGLAVQIAPTLKDKVIDAHVLGMQADVDWFCRWKLVHAVRDLDVSEGDKLAALAKLSADSDLTVRQSALKAIKEGWHKKRVGPE